MQKFVDDGVVAGAVTLVARQGDVVSFEAVGYADLAAKKPMRTDNMFWIASMTKPIVATAILMLQDEGRLAVDDPVEKYLPEFGNQMMIAEKTADGLVLKHPARKVTLRDLLTHTSGLQGDLPDVDRDLTLAERSLTYALRPLAFEPGSKWQYSGPGINTLGRIIEVVSHDSFADFLKKRLFQPLGMKDTTFWPSSEQAARIAKSYGPGANDHGLAEIKINIQTQLPLTSHERTPLPAGGLFSTASDLVKFYQMVLNGGSYNGKQYLSAASVILMTSPQTGGLTTGFTEGFAWGLGWGVVRQPTGVTAMLSPGSFGHGGAYGTQGWIDPKTRTIYILLIQRPRLLPNGDASEIRRVFQQTASDAIADQPKTQVDVSKR
jgi:CubicO group peptidase (beta-lactamase class C family)